MGGDVEDVATAEAEAPQADAMRIDAGLSAEEVQAGDDVLGLVERVHQLPDHLHADGGLPVPIGRGQGAPDDEAEVAVSPAPIVERQDHGGHLRRNGTAAASGG